MGVTVVKKGDRPYPGKAGEETNVLVLFGPKV